MNQSTLKLVRRPPVIRLYGDHELIIDSFAGGGGADNPRFDRERFLKACGIE